MALRDRKKSLVGGLMALAVGGAILIPAAASSAPAANGRFTGFVGPGFVSNGCAARTNTMGATQSPINLRITPGGVGSMGALGTKVRISFAGNVLPSVVVSAATQWKATIPAGTPVPCKRLRSVVKFQPLKANGTPTGKIDTDMIGFSLCASPCVPVAA